MKKLNKIVALVLAAVMSVSLLACGGNKGAADKGEAVTSGDKVTINVYRRCFNLAEPDQAQVKKVEDAITGEMVSRVDNPGKSVTVTAKDNKIICKFK